MAGLDSATHQLNESTRADARNKMGGRLRGGHDKFF
jgi:hypothetical protein